METAITGIGWVTAQGAGFGGQGRGFAPDNAPLPLLTRKEVFDQPNQRFGRQSNYSKVGLSAIAFALRDAAMEQWTEKRPVGVIAATRLGCLTTDVDYYETVLPRGGGLASPNLFAYTLANCFLGEAAIQFGLTGSAYVINDSIGDGLCSVSMALESLALGECVTMLAGICDLPAPPLPGLPAGPTGAVFLVLDTTREGNASPYGGLDLAADGTIRHNGTEVASFIGLVTACLLCRGT